MGNVVQGSRSRLDLFTTLDVLAKWSFKAISIQFHPFMFVTSGNAAVLKSKKTRKIPNFQSQNEKTQIHSALEHSRARVLVRRRHGIVNVDLDARVRSFICTREGDLVGRVGAASTGDGELSARDVELGAAR